MAIKDTIHVCYGVVDEKGSYSKFVGTSICSLLENTTSRVVVHLLYGGNLTEGNREKFRQLEEKYGQEIRLCNVQEAIPDTWQQAMDLFPKGMNAPRYTGANMYRLAIPEILSEESRAIYLDADTIVNMDIASLWAEEIGESGLAAVADLDVLNHFGKGGVIKPTKSFLYTECNATVDTIFNSGIMLMDLERLRGREQNLLLEGLQFLKDHAEDFEFYDNDILIAFFAKNFTRLPWYYDIRLEWDQEFGDGKLVPGIYHYLGRNYGLNPQDPRHRLFLAYWSMSPWSDWEAPWRIYRGAVDGMRVRAQARIAQMRRIYNLCCHKQRVFVGLAMDEERLRADFALGEEEPYISLTPGGDIHLPYDTADHAYIFFWGNYPELKEIMEKAGKKEYEDFADGRLLMPEQVNDMSVEERGVLWRM